MKIYFVVTIARQVDGEMLSIKFEKAFTQKDKVEQYVKDLAKMTVETIQVPGVGAVEFVCERGYHEIEMAEGD